MPRSLSRNGQVTFAVPFGPVCTAIEATFHNAVPADDSCGRAACARGFLLMKGGASPSSFPFSEKSRFRSHQQEENIKNSSLCSAPAEQLELEGERNPQRRRGEGKRERERKQGQSHLHGLVNLRLQSLSPHTLSPHTSPLKCTHVHTHTHARARTHTHTRTHTRNRRPQEAWKEESEEL